MSWVKRKQGNKKQQIAALLNNSSQLLSAKALLSKLRFTNDPLVFLADEWIKFDDDKVSIVTPEDILRLSGGGDWHIAYVLLYGPRRIEVVEEEAEQ